jgi:hypothetical protein
MPGLGGADNGYLKDALAMNEAGSRANQQNLAMKQGEQGLAEGKQKLQGGEYTLANQKATQEAVDALHNAKSQDEIDQASAKLLTMQGHNPNEWELKPVGGKEVMGPDGTVSTVGGYVAAIHKRTGEVKLYGQPKDQVAPAGGPPQGVRHVDAQGNVAYKLPNGTFVDANGKPV